MQRRIIGFAGRARSGKSYLADICSVYTNGKVLTIAKYLKEMCCEMIGCNSIDELNFIKNETSDDIIFNPKDNDSWVEIIHLKTNIDKNIIQNELNALEPIVGVRSLLQIIGTNIIRKYYPDWHIDSLINELHTLDENTNIFIDDVRFPNEVEKIKNEGGSVLFVIRPNTFDVASNHPSETALQITDFKPEEIIINDYNRMEIVLSIIGYMENTPIGISFLSSRKGLLETYTQLINAKEAKIKPYQYLDFINYKTFLDKYNKFGVVLIYNNPKRNIEITNPLLIEVLKLYKN